MSGTKLLNVGRHIPTRWLTCSGSISIHSESHIQVVKLMLVASVFGSTMASGSIGSVTGYNGKGGLQLRGRSKPVNPNSPGQVAVRQSMSVNSQAWNDTLTSAQRTAWNEYAAGTPLPNGLGFLFPTTGRAMFMRSNVARNQVGLASVIDAPITPGVAPAPEFIFQANTTDGVEVLLTSPVLVFADLVNFRTSIPVNPAVNFFKSPFTLSAAAVAATGFPLNVRPAAQTFVGQKYFIASRFYASDGKVSFEVIESVEVLV